MMVSVKCPKCGKKFKVKVFTLSESLIELWDNDDDGVWDDIGVDDE